jgi:site-specific recombinase XerD
MREYDLGVMTELALRKLKSEGILSTQKLYSLKSMGLRPLLKHFECIGNLFVNNDMLKDYLDKQYDTYKGDRKQAWRWQIIRRSAELIMYFVATGRVDLPPLPRWNKRDCLFYVEPTAEQLANNDNINGLVWRTRYALRKLGYADKTIKYYDQSGFRKLLDAHRYAGTEVYSRKICAQLVLDTKRLVDNGKLHRYQAIRKTAALLHEFHQYGTIAPAQLSPFDQVLLTPAFEALVDEYSNDALFSEKMGEVTARTAKSIIKGFLLDLEESGFSSFDGVTLAAVGSVIAQTAANRYKRGADSLLHYVRDFLKYLHEYNYIESDLSVAVPKIAAPRKKVYQGFSDKEIRKLLAAVDRNTLKGKRDYAIMMLAAQTGLRSVDILKLKRSDIDWRKRELHIVQSKTSKPLCLALETESGNAICDYILNARQECNIPNIFLSSMYPLRAMQPTAAQGIIQKYMAIAGIHPTEHQRYGFHSFRRAFGTRLLESGTPVHLLSQLLGHFDLDSAKPYMSTSEKGLKECCLPLTFDESKGDTK